MVMVWLSPTCAGAFRPLKLRLGRCCRRCDRQKQIMDSADEAAVEAARDDWFDDRDVPLQIIVKDDPTEEEVDEYRYIHALQRDGMLYGIQLDEMDVMERYVAGDAIAAAFYNMEVAPLIGDTEEERVACARQWAGAGSACAS